MIKIKEKFASFKKMTKADIKKFLKNTLFVLLGTLILALGTELFLIPASLVTGGVSGIAIVLSFMSIPISIEIVITIINWVLFILGLIFLGMKFSMRTLCSTISYPLFLMFVKWLTIKFPWILIVNAPSLGDNQAIIALLSSIFSGFLIGAGCAITFLGGGSTRGVDIITFILCKFFKSIKSSISIFVIDALVIVLGFIVNPNHDLALCLEGVFSAFIASLVIDKIFAGGSKFFVAYIITDKYLELTTQVQKVLERTTSILDIEGGYSHENKKMVMVSYSMREYNMLMGLIASIDKKAFMTIHQAHDINGEGFRPIKRK